MSDNMKKDSGELLKQIRGQLGIEPLSSGAIENDKGSVEEIEGSTDSQSTSQNPLLQYGIAAAIGLGVIGIPLSIMLGINGGDNNSTTAKLDASKDKSDKVVSQTTNTDSAEVERLKTQVALDFQAKAPATGTSGAVAGTPGATGTPGAVGGTPGAGTPTPIRTTAPTNQLQQPLGKQQTQVAQTQELQPLGKQQTQIAPAQAVKPLEKQQTQVAQTQELQPLGKQQTRVASAQANQPLGKQQTQVARASLYPVPKPVAIPAAVRDRQSFAPKREEKFVSSRIDRIEKTAPEKPQVAPRRRERFIRDRKIASTKRESTGTSPVTAPRVVNPVQPPAPQPQPMGYQEAVALSMYGGAEETAVKPALAQQLPPTVALIPQLSPSLPLPIGVVVEGHTITPYNAISKGTAAGGADIGVMLDRQIQLAQGYVLPIGTVIQFSISVADNGMIQAVSKGVYINNTEIKAPLGAFSLTAENNTALIAEQRALRQGEITSSDIKTGLWGAAGTVGQVLVQSGNTTSIQTGGGVTSTVQTTNPTPNILGAVMQGAFQPLTQVQQQRSNAIAQEVQALSKINTLAINTKVKVFVAIPGVIQIPIADLPQPSQSIGNSTELSPQAVYRSTLLLDRLTEIVSLLSSNLDRST